jgi:hypothetical protein
MAAKRKEFAEWGFAVGDRVYVVNARDYKRRQKGTIAELWSGSEEERISGQYGLDKYLVKLDGGSTVTGSTWVYSNDLFHGAEEYEATLVYPCGSTKQVRGYLLSLDLVQSQIAPFVIDQNQEDQIAFVSDPDNGYSQPVLIPGARVRVRE